MFDGLILLLVLFKFSRICLSSYCCVGLVFALFLNQCKFACIKVSFVFLHYFVFLR